MKKKILEIAKKYGPIQIRCEARDALPIDVILDFQGKLKRRSEANLLKLIERIFKLGFIAPFFVWQQEGSYRILDGHGRLYAIIVIREAGIEIPGLFPVVYVEAETEEEAREMLLSISSQYGEFDEEELNEWLSGLDSEIADQLRLVDKEIETSTDNIESLLFNLSFAVTKDQREDIMKKIKRIKRENNFDRLGDALFKVINEFDGI